MEKEFLTDTITLIDENGKETKFEIMDFVEHKNRLFYALFPASDFENNEEAYDNEYIMYYIFEAKRSGSGDETYFEEVRDDNLHNELAVIFEKHFNEDI